MFGFGRSNHDELAMAVAVESGHRRGRSEGGHLPDGSFRDGPPVTPFLTDVRGREIAILTSDLTRPVSHSWLGSQPSSYRYFRAVGRAGRGEALHQVLKYRRDVFSGIVDMFVNLNDRFFIHCDRCDGDDGTLAYDEDVSNVDSGDSDSIDNSTLPSTESLVQRNQNNSGNIETGPIYRDVLDTRSDVNPGSIRQRKIDGPNEVPNCGTWYSNPSDQPLPTAQLPYVQPSASIERLPSTRGAPRRPFTPVAAPPYRDAADLDPAKGKSSGKLDADPTEKGRRSRSKSTHRNRSSGQKTRSIPPELQRKSTKVKKRNENVRNNNGYSAGGRANSVSGRGRRSTHSRSKAFHSGKVVQTKSRKSLKSAQPLDLYSPRSGNSTRGRSHSWDPQCKRESSRSASRRRNRSVSNRFSGRSMFEYIRGRSHSRRERADRMKKYQDDSKKRAKKTETSTLGSWESPVPHEEGISSHPNTGSEEKITSNESDFHGNMTKAPPADMSKIDSHDGIAVERRNTANEDYSHKRRVEYMEGSGQTEAFKEPITGSRGTEHNRKTLLGRRHAKSLKVYCRTSDPVAQKTEAGHSLASKAGQKNSSNHSRSLFSWRKNSPKVEIVTSVTADTTSQRDDSYHPCDSGLAFPVPNEDGQEIALKDGNHCYEDPANVLSLLTMPSFSPEAKGSVSEDMLEGEPNNCGANQMEDECATIGTETASVASG